MYASDYPHGESHFPESVSLVITQLHAIVRYSLSPRTALENEVQIPASDR
jgi:hypothetical protein